MTLRIMARWVLAIGLAWIVMADITWDGPSCGVQPRATAEDHR